MESKKSFQTLKTRKDFLALQRQGHRLYPTPWMIINFTENQLGVLRVGWTIPRYVGNAVLRNKLKRWCREYFRQAVGSKKRINYDLNVVLRKRDKDFYRNISYQEFCNGLERAAKKVLRKYDAFHQ